MPPIKSFAAKCCFKLVLFILSLSEIMPTYSYYTEKWLVCIAIITPFSHQPSSYTKCTCINIQSSCNICLVSNIKCRLYLYFFASKNT